ncbi:hypothetical protein SB337_18300, partial [Escherichia coli]|nr:hypothetical protein [Escherichia coli]
MRDLILQLSKSSIYSTKPVYTHRRNAEAKLYSKIYKLVQ